MKIAKIETFFVSRFLVVRITTEDGIQGRSSRGLHLFHNWY